MNRINSFNKQGTRSIINRKTTNINSIETLKQLEDISILNKQLEDKVDKTEYVHLFEVYADEACTQRPIVGKEYESLFVQINSSTPYCEYGTITNNIAVIGPDTKYPDDSYFLNIYIDYFGEIPDQFFNEQGQIIIVKRTIVVECSNSDTYIPNFNFDVSFGPLIKKVK